MKLKLTLKDAEARKFAQQGASALFGGGGDAGGSPTRPNVRTSMSAPPQLKAVGGSALSRMAARMGAGGRGGRVSKHG